MEKILMVDLEAETNAFQDFISKDWNDKMCIMIESHVAKLTFKIERYKEIQLKGRYYDKESIEMDVYLTKWIDKMKEKRTDLIKSLKRYTIKNNYLDENPSININSFFKMVKNAKRV